MTVSSVKFDSITYDPNTKEWTLHVIEHGPWREEELEERLRALQTRLFDVFQMAVDGHLAAIYPQTKGSAVCIQVDCYGGAPHRVFELVERFRYYIANDPEYQRMIAGSEFIHGLRMIANSSLPAVINNQNAPGPRSFPGWLGPIVGVLVGFWLVVKSMLDPNAPDPGSWRVGLGVAVGIGFFGGLIVWGIDLARKSQK